uniref:Uncharacterized protein n=1 Tax=Rhizophora mucronata TaxID=61149 RepID=A0A2P2KVX3_RHIMU
MAVCRKEDGAEEGLRDSLKQIGHRFLFRYRNFAR